MFRTDSKFILLGALAFMFFYSILKASASLSRLHSLSISGFHWNPNIRPIAPDVPLNRDTQLNKPTFYLCYHAFAPLENDK